MTGIGEVTRRQEVITSYWLVIATVWDWETTVVLGCFALLVDYCFAAGLRLTRRIFCFALGDVVLLFALVSPWDTLGDTYLFSDTCCSTSCLSSSFLRWSSWGFFRLSGRGPGVGHFGVASKMCSHNRWSREQ